MKDYWQQSLPTFPAKAERGLRRTSRASVLGRGPRVRQRGAITASKPTTWANEPPTAVFEPQ